MQSFPFRRRQRRRTPRRVLITGASSGIGRALAKELPRDAALLLAGRNDEALEEVKGELGEGREVELVTADLAKKDDLDRLIERAEAFEIDLLINNAGLGSFGTFLENELEKERLAVQVNVEAPTVLARALLPGMIERAERDDERGGLINISSTTAFVPVPHLAVYSASKAYILSLTEALAAELAREPIDVLTVCPGATKTSFGKRAGFSPGSLPGAIAPERVAQKALEALGRRSVVFTDPGSEISLLNLVRARAALARGIDLGVGTIGRVMGARAG